MPETTRSGRSGTMPSSASPTQSDGVPVVVKSGVPSASVPRLMRSGLCIVFVCPAADQL